MTVLNPLALYSQALDMLANADCPDCCKKDRTAKMPGRKDTGLCEWCTDRRLTIEQSRQWLQRDTARAAAIVQTAGSGSSSTTGSVLKASVVNAE